MIGGLLALVKAGVSSSAGKPDCAFCLIKYSPLHTVLHEKNSRVLLFGLPAAKNPDVYECSDVF